MTRTAWCSAVVAVSSPEADPTSTGMSQRPCRCSPRPPSSFCRCSALTAAGRPRSSDGEWGEGAGGTRPRKGVRGWGAAATEPDPLPSPVCAPRRARRSRAGVGGGSWGGGGGKGWDSGRGGPQCRGGWRARVSPFQAEPGRQLRRRRRSRPFGAPFSRCRIYLSLSPPRLKRRQMPPPLPHPGAWALTGLASPRPLGSGQVLKPYSLRPFAMFTPHPRVCEQFPRVFAASLLLAGAGDPARLSPASSTRPAPWGATSSTPQDFHGLTLPTPAKWRDPLIGPGCTGMSKQKTSPPPFQFSLCPVTRFQGLGSKRGGGGKHFF